MIDFVDELVERHFGGINGITQVGGVPISAIVERYGTPLFLYDAAVLDRKWALLRHALPEQFSIYYSMKANPNPTIVRYFIEKGAGIEIASGGELSQALRVGCDPDKILFAGPGKTEGELEFALKNRIGEIHVESPREVDRISALSIRLGVKPSVSLRINPSGEVQGGAMRMGGKPAAFGVDEEQIDTLIDRLDGDPALDFGGVHLFTGTQILDDEVLFRQYRKGIDLARQVAGRLKRPLKTIDFGGGLGIRYFQQEQELNVSRLQGHIAELMQNLQGDPLFAGTRFIVEPGRYLVGESGIYITRVNDVKVSRGKTFVILDGGMNHHLAASGNLGQVIKRNFPAAVLSALGKPRTMVADLVGPLCTPLDTLGRDVALAPASVGDLVGIFQSGAYARTSSPLGFLGHPTPPEILVRSGQAELIRRRGTYEDLVADIPFESGSE